MGDERQKCVLENVKLRTFVSTDAEALVSVYRDAVRTLGPQAYSYRQVAVWARYPEDIEEFRDRLSRGRTVVAERGGNILAFGQLDPDDHLAFLYCKGEFSRKGIGSDIYDDLEAHASRTGVQRLFTEASRISRPFFEKKGFRIVEVETATRCGVEFERFRMENILRFDTKESC